MSDAALVVFEMKFKRITIVSAGCLAEMPCGKSSKFYVRLTQFFVKALEI